MAHLSTHVLNTSLGKPAAAVAIDLHRVDGDGRLHLLTLTTNADGRVAGQTVDPGVYELTFHAGDYLRGTGVELSDPPFLDNVVIRFGIAEADGRYHVPLLLSPYGYSTYRGS